MNKRLWIATFTFVTMLCAGAAMAADGADPAAVSSAHKGAVRSTAQTMSDTGWELDFTDSNPATKRRTPLEFKPGALQSSIRTKSNQAPMCLDESPLSALAGFFGFGDPEALTCDRSN